MTAAPLAFYPDTNQWSEIVPPVPPVPPVIPPAASFDSPADLAAFNFAGAPPDYVSVALPDGRPQNFQRVADYPVSVIERLGNPNFDTTDFWAFTPPNANITGGNLVYTANANVTQSGIRPTVIGGTYQVTTVVTARTGGQVTPQLIGGPDVCLPVSTVGTNVQRVVATVATTQLRYAAALSTVMTIASVSFKRVMTHACVLSADGLIWAPVGDINVLAYGVVADGVADDTAALLNAIAIATNLGRKALLPPSRMRATGSILDFIGSGTVQIAGDPIRSVLVNEMVAAGSMISVAGRVDAYNKNDLYLTAPAVQGARTLTLNDTSQFTVDQDILIKDWNQPVEYNDKIYSDDLTRICALTGEINRVKSIDSPTQLTLARQLEFPLTIRAALTGTVSTTSGVNVVTGVGTAFLTELVDHNYITIAGITSTFLKIRKVVSNTTLWIDIAATPVSTTVSGAIATKIGTVVQRFLDQAVLYVDGLRVEGSTAVTVPNSNNLFSLNGVRRYTLRDVSFYSAGCGEFTVAKSLRGRLVNYHSVDAGKVGLDAYSIKVANGCRTLFIDHAYAQRPRHLITTVTDETEIEPAWVYHTGCHVDQPMVAAYDQHPGARNFIFTGCGASGSDFDGTPGNGFQLRGRFITLNGCQASGINIGLNVAFGDHIRVDGFLADHCSTSFNLSQSHHIDVKDLLSMHALTNDVALNARYWTAGVEPLPDIRVQGRGMGNPAGASVELTNNWGTDWVIDFRNPDATLKYDATIPASYWPGNNFRELNAKEFGAKGDGVTDDAPAIRAALIQAMALRETLIIPKGNYYCATSLTDATPHSFVKIRGDGDDTVLFTHVENDALFLNLGTLTTGSTTSAPAVMGDRTLTMVSTTGYVADQDIEIRDQSQNVVDWVDGTTPLAKKGEMNRVRTVTDSTHLLLWSRLEDNYNSGTLVNRLTNIPTDWDIRDLAFQHTPGAAISASQRGILISRARRIRLSNLSFKGFDSTCIRLTFGLDAMLTDIRGESLNSSMPLSADNKNPYLVCVGEGSNGILCERLYLRQGRHCFTTAGDPVYIEPAHITVSDSSAYECMAAAFDTHPASRRVTFDNCEAWGSDEAPWSTFGAGDGFQLRGRQSAIQNCRANGVKIGAFIPSCEESSIFNSVFSNCDIGVQLHNAPKATVRDVIIRNAKTNGVLASHANSPVIPGITLRNVSIYGNTTGAAVDFSAYWHDSYVLDGVRAPDATVKWLGVPTSHSHGIIDKTANFTAIANLSCVYRCTGTFTATLPLLATETGEATYTFKVVSGTLTIDGNGAETIDGVASITPTGTVRVKKNGETGSWVSW